MVIHDDQMIGGNPHKLGNQHDASGSKPNDFLGIPGVDIFRVKFDAHTNTKITVEDSKTMKNPPQFLVHLDILKTKNRLRMTMSESARSSHHNCPCETGLLKVCSVDP